MKQNHIGMSFAYISAGSFLMGSDETENSLSQDFSQYELTRLSEFYDESPLHKVIITKPFWMGQHPVTIKQFELLSCPATINWDDSASNRCSIF